MIARLRRRHRWMITLLAIATPLVFMWALLNRREMPLVEPAPDAAHTHAEEVPAAP